MTTSTPIPFACDEVVSKKCMIFFKHFSLAKCPVDPPTALLTTTTTAVENQTQLTLARYEASWQAGVTERTDSARQTESPTAGG